MKYAILSANEICTTEFWKQYKTVDWIVCIGNPLLSQETTDVISRWLHKEVGISIGILNKSNFVTFVEAFSRALGKFIPVVDAVTGNGTEVSIDVTLETSPVFNELLDRPVGDILNVLYPKPKKEKKGGR